MDAMEMYKFKLLLASSLREKPESYLVEELLNRYTDKAGLMNLTENELLEIKGIGKAKAKQIVSVFELSRMLMKVPTSNRYTIRSPQDAADLLIPEIGHLQHEVFCVIYLNTKNQVINNKHYTIHVGTLNSCLAHPRDCYKLGVRLNAASCIIAHNHPSFQLDPSPEDIQVCERYKEAGEVLGISLLDSLIIGGNKYLSIKEQGLM